MNDLDDLRQTLTEHAALPALDLAPVDRSRAVHARVRVVRRRRRTAAAGVLAAVIAAAGVDGVLQRHGHPPEAAQQVVGVSVPPHLTSLGYTYDLAQTVAAPTGMARLTLPPSAEPRLVSWATSGDLQRVLIHAPTLDAPPHASAPDFTDFLYVPAGDTATRVDVGAAAGQTGLAVYTLDAARPAGVTSDGVTYRQTIAGGTLLGAAIGTTGQGEVQVRASAVGPGVSVRSFCSGGPADAWIHVSYLDPSKGGFERGQGCDDSVSVDAASLGGTGISTRPGEDVGFRVYVTHGEHGPRVSDPGLRIGLAVYGLESNPLKTHFTPQALEYAGHTWGRVREARTAPGRTSLVTSAPAGPGTVLAVVFSSGNPRSRAQVEATFAGQTGVGFTGAGATQQVLQPGTRTRVDLSGGSLGAHERLGVAFYTEAD